MPSTAYVALFRRYTKIKIDGRLLLLIPKSEILLLRAENLNQKFHLVPAISVIIDFSTKKKFSLIVVPGTYL